MYEDYIEFLIKLDSNADAVLETCILPKYLRVNDEVAGLTVSNFIVTPLIDESRVYDGHHIEFDGEIVVEGLLGYNDYYGSYEIIVRDLEQIPHLPRDREMHILIVNEMAFAEMLNFEVGEELVFVISKLTLAYDLSKPTMNSATVIEVSK